MQLDGRILYVYLGSTIHNPNQRHNYIYAIDSKAQRCDFFIFRRYCYVA